MAVLLIGSTGNGKSTLGNFLIDPDPEKPAVFEVATDNKPFTQHTKVEKVRVSVASEKNDLIIIDTPGLNECKEKDLQHMTELIKSLNEVKLIRACIFVVKFDLKIDQQYKDTVQYYAKLLPTLFSQNVLVVMTNYPTDERSVAMRKKQHINEEAIRENTKVEIVKSAAMSSRRSPMLFAVDCMPFDDAEKKVSSKMREKLLDHIFSLQPIEVGDLRVAKPKAIEEDDLRKKKEHEGKISGYKFRLQERNKDAKDALEEIGKRKSEITTIQSSMVNTRQRLAEIDNDKEVLSVSKSVDCGWNLFPIGHHDFDLESSTDISSVRKWKNSGNEWVNYNETRRRVRVTLQRGWFSTLAGEVTLYTSRKWSHGGEISLLKAEISRKECDLRFAEKEAQRCREMHKKHKEVIEVLEKHIEKVDEDIIKIASNTMTIEEAQRRIEELSQSS